MHLGIIFIIAFLLTADLVAWRLALRWLKRYAPSKMLRLAAHSFFAMQTGYVIVLILAGTAHAQHVMAWIPLGVQAMIYIWHLLFLPATMVIWSLVGLAGAGRWLVQRCRSPKPELPALVLADDSGKGMSRRDMLLASVAIVPPLMAMSTAGYSRATLWQFRVSRQVLPVFGLPAALEGFRIAHVSDLHVGRWSTRSFLESVVEATNALDADVVAFTGDLIDVSIDDLPLAVATFKRFRARQGAFIIEGNHDLIDDPAAFRKAMTDEGLRFLRGSSVMLKQRGTAIEFMGVPWSHSEEQIRQEVLSIAGKRDIGAFPILLAHHPHSFDAAAEVGLPLTLSGHTHGGQIALNREINAGRMLFRYVSGIYQRGGSKLLVSNGIGNWFPLRIGAPAEIIEITLAQG